MKCYFFDEGLANKYFYGKLKKQIFSLQGFKVRQINKLIFKANTQGWGGGIYPFLNKVEPMNDNLQERNLHNV